VLKASIFLLKAIFFIVILFIASLMYGITLFNLSYNDISISQLYLKYDKELILHIKDLKVASQDKIDDIKISVEKYEDKYKININKFNYQSLGITLQANTILSYEEIKKIISSNKKELIANNVYFNYDSNLPDIVASKVYLDFVDDTLSLTFLNPHMNNIKLDGTTVKIKSISSHPILELNLKTKHFLNDKLLDIISYYGFDIPISQVEGSNDISLELILSLVNQEIHTNLDFTIDNAVFKYDDFKLKSKKLHIVFEKEILKIKSQKIKLNAFDKIYKLSDLELTLNDKIININSNIEDEDKNLFKINQIVNQDNNTSSGTILVQYYNFENNIILKDEIFDLNIDFKKDIEINLFSNDNINIQNQNLVFSNTNVFYKNDKVYFNTVIKDDENNTFTLSNTIDLNQKSINGNFLINKYKYKNIIDLNIRNFDFTAKYSDGFKLYINEFDFEYNKKDNTNVLHIGKFNKILVHFKFLKIKTWNINSKIDLYSSNNFENTNILLSNLNIKVDDKLFSNEDKQKIKEKSKFYFPKTQIVIHKSSIEYENRVLNTDYSIFMAHKDEMILELQPRNEKSKINILIKSDKIYIDAKKLSEDFINKLANKTVFKDGSIDLSIQGDKHNFVGGLKFNKTYIVDVRVLNNLITFINTTPAIINPLLALPILLRMGETSFDASKYYIKKGHVDFVYNIENKNLYLTDIYTKSNLTDFRGYGVVNTNKKTVNFKVDAIFLKDYSKFIKHIPILGYIVVGENGNFVTNIDIDGTLDEQSFTTHTVKNLSQGIFGMIKRTLSTPFLPFMGDNKSHDSSKVINEILNQED